MKILVAIDLLEPAADHKSISPPRHDQQEVSYPIDKEN